MPARRVPTEIKRRTGTVNVTREGRRPPEPAVAWVPMPDPPDGSDDDSSRVWSDLKTVVDALGAAAQSDVPAFRNLVRLQLLLTQAYAAIPVDADLVLRIQARVDRLMAEFGLTPASRTRLAALKTPEATSALARLFN
ncbi:hypothetical protein [Anaeromyxobacter dehalogenans]|nr:hypothetical protein [Anaeromyxobacter dehalogenans]